MTRGKWIILGMLILLGGMLFLLVKEKRVATSPSNISEAHESQASGSVENVDDVVEGDERLNSVAAGEQAISSSARQLRVIVQTDQRLGLAGAEVQARFRQEKGKRSLSEFNRTFTTDSEGITTVPLPEESVARLELVASQNDYAARKRVWDITTGDRIPLSYTFTLTNGLFIGGNVFDAEGSPIKGVKIRVYNWQPGGSFPKGESAGAFGQTQITDEKGHWTARNVPAELLQGMTIEAEHPDFLAVQFRVSDAEVESQLRAVQHNWVLDRLQRVHGRVLSETGAPISEATVWLGRPSSRERQSTKSDDQGRFEFRDVTAGKFPISGMARGYAPDTKVIEVSDGEAEEIIFQLSKGSFIRGTVVDPNGKPLKGVRVNFEDRPAHESNHNFEYTQITEEDGKFEWDSAPNEPMPFYFGKPGYLDQRRVMLKPGEEHVVTLQKTRWLEGVVLDSETGEPVMQFNVSLGKMGGDDYLSSSYSMEGFKSELGQFRIELSSVDADGIRILAKDYVEHAQFLPQVRDELRLVTVKLKRSRTLAGVVIGPNGSPVSGAGVATADARFDGRTIRVSKNGRIHGTDGMVTTDASGRFEITSPPEQGNIVASADVGFGIATMREVRSSGLLMLQPFGRIEGMLINRSGAVEGQELMLASVTSGMLFNLSDYRTTSDAGGAFIFENVPPGRMSIVRLVPTFSELKAHSHQTECVVVAGQTTQVTLGGENATLNGTVRFDGAPPGAQFQIAGQLSTIMPEISQGSPEWREQMRERRNYIVSVGSDGTWILDSIAPGEYTLEIIAAEAVHSGAPKILASGFATVTVPEGATPATPIDIGEIVLKRPEK